MVLIRRKVSKSPDIETLARKADIAVIIPPFIFEMDFENNALFKQILRRGGEMKITK